MNIYKLNMAWEKWFKSFIKLIVYRIEFSWNFTTLKEFLASPTVIDKKTMNYCKRTSHINFARFYYPMIYSLIEQCKKQKNVQKIKNDLFDMLPLVNEKSRVVLLRLLVEAQITDDRIINEFVSIASETTDKELRYWMTMDVEKVAFLNNLTPYSSYYIKRRELFKKISCENDLRTHCIDNRRNNSIKKSKLCVISYMIAPTIQNSVQRVAMMIVNGMKKYFSEIEVVTLDSFSAKSNCFIDSVRKYQESNSDIKKIKELFGDNVHVCCPEQGDFRHHMQYALDKIYEFDPEVIIDISDEFSPISYLYSKDYYTIYLPLRGYTSCSYFSVFLTGNMDVCEQVNKKYLSVQKEKMISWVFPEYRPDFSKAFVRSRFGLNDDEFILVTVGNPSSYSNDFYDSVCQLLEEYKPIRWIIVGGDISDYVHEKYRKLIGDRKIIVWGFENKLAEFYHICDVFVNPNRVGSSGAIAIAAQQGLPIVTTNFPNDAMRWIGIENSVEGDYSVLMKKIVNLYSDKKYYKNQSELFQELVNSESDTEKIWGQLIEIITQVGE